MKLFSLARVNIPMTLPAQRTVLTAPCAVLPALCAVLFNPFPSQADSVPKGLPNGASAASPPTVTNPASNGNNEVALTRYQLALDQLSAGNLSAARLILEDGIRRTGPQNDLNLLLGYVLQREGKDQTAKERLAQAPSSPLASLFSAQLFGAPLPNSAVKPQALENNLPQIVPVAAPSTAPSKVPSSVSLPQTDARLAKLEADMVALVNEERQKVGLKPLTTDEKLANVARAHSAEMRDKSYFAHESPTAGLREPIDRYQSAVKDQPRIIAENIFRSWGAQRLVGISDVKEGHESLMKSPGHRANILYQEVTHIGVGFAANGRGDLWITQMFLRP